MQMVPMLPVLAELVGQTADFFARVIGFFDEFRPCVTPQLKH
jgi:hypothetical protein